MPRRRPASTNEGEAFILSAAKDLVLPAYDRNNIFARILRGEAPCTKVYEDEYALAFRDIYPKARVHVLAIPKGEYVSLIDFSQSAPPGPTLEPMR